ncbi:hypothetical protein IW262DRAFT_1407887 [Armillaria fumosa]|nr:hypothetical protein IW262DRAFT_1407887 [Armillaria fumosa]
MFNKSSIFLVATLALSAATALGANTNGAQARSVGRRSAPNTNNLNARQVAGMRHPQRRAVSTSEKKRRAELVKALRTIDSRSLEEIRRAVNGISARQAEDPSSTGSTGQPSSSTPPSGGADGAGGPPGGDGSSDPSGSGQYAASGSGGRQGGGHGGHGGHHGGCCCS